MLSLICPHCNTETPDEYNFCLTCDKQVKCLNPECNKKLIAGKTFCFGCGQPLASMTFTRPLPNKYVRNVTQKGEDYQEHTEFNVSDHAVSELAPFIVGQMVSPSHRRAYNSSSINTTFATPKALNEITHPVEEEPSPSAEPQQEVIHEQSSSSLSQASRYFERDGEVLIPKEKDFKGENWSEQQRHFVLLYASAYFDIFQKPVPSEEHFKIVSKMANVYDSSNFSRHLGKAVNEHFSKLSDGFKLNDRGQKEVVRILSLMADEKALPGHDYWARTPGSSPKRHRMSKEDIARVESWTTEEVELGNLKVRDIKSARDYAMVSLWIITVHLKKANAVRWNDAYHFFKKKFETMSASPEAFSIAIRNEANKEYFRQTDEMFYLSSEGVKNVEEWIHGNPASPVSGYESEAV